MSKLLAYRVLMPAHYTPRRDKNGKPETDSNGSRKWLAARLPAIRLFGPFWSFGFRVAEMPKNTIWPIGDDTRLRGLRTLAEDVDSRSNLPLDHIHYPTLMSARLESFLQVSADPGGLAGSRMSLLAIRSIDQARIDRTGRLSKLDPDDFPVANSVPVEGAPTVIAAPFGDPHPKPHTSFDKALNEIAAVSEQHLQAMQLLAGRVRFTPSKAYLDKVRTALRLLEPPEDFAGADAIILLPDGFAVAGEMKLPWMVDVAAWFKVCYKWRDADGRDDAKNVVPQPVLRPWIDAENDAAGLRVWSSAIATLEALLRSASAQQRSPRWLDVRPNATLAAENFFWPLAYDGAKDEPSILIHRPDDHILALEGSGLLARLSDRPLGKGPVSTMTIEPETFLIRDEGKGAFVISTDPILGDGSDLTEATYVFSAALDQSSSIVETMDIDTFDAKGKKIGAVNLAIPMIDTAERLRQAMGLPRPMPDEDTEAPAVLPSLWAFTPLSEGWLHWPLPNATLAILSRFFPAGFSPKPDKVPSGDEAADGISGAIMFSNRAGNPGYSGDRREWALSMGEPRQGDLWMRVQIQEAGKASITDAKMQLRGFTISLDGAVPVTPFRQTPERLLPDHAERALATSSLLAISPSGLGKIERDLLEVKDAPTFSLSIVGLGIARGQDEDKGPFNAIAGEVSWRFFNPTANAFDKPWIWVRHHSMPTVQTMPMAAAGKALNTPAEDRSLAPFVYTGPTGDLIYHATGALDMSRFAITLHYPEQEKQSLFRRPPGLGAIDWPWREEIGMAITTLPSLTLFPGTSVAGSVSTLDVWSSYNSPDDTGVVARHDIALRDQFSALSVAPVKPQPGEEEPPQLAVFRPRPDNAPIGIATWSGDATNGYDHVWSQLSRKAGLAALDRRDLLKVEDKEVRLTGVFGELDYKVQPPTFSFDIDFIVDKSGIATGLAAIGEWSLGKVDGLKSETGGEKARLDFAGFPQSSDLAGVSGIFKRGKQEVEVRNGTAVLSASEGVFVDQYGIEMHRPDRGTSNGNNEPKNDPDVIVKSLRARTTSVEARLLTLVRPLKLADEGDLSFWCADAPVDTKEFSFLRAYADNPRLNLAGGDLDHDGFAGFRWTLARQSRPADVVAIGGLAFEPLELVGIDADPETNALKRVEIRGRLLLPVGASSVLPRAGGTATLVLTPRGDGTLDAGFENIGIVWPLADPQTTTGIVPTLVLPGLPESDKSIAGDLTFGLAGVPFSVPVTLSRPAKGEGLLIAHVDDGHQQATSFGAITTKALDLEIGRATYKDNGIEAEPPHSAQLAFTLEIGAPDARVKATLMHDLLGSDAVDMLTDMSFTTLAGTNVAIVADVAAKADLATAFAFGADHLALRWRIPETGEGPNPVLLDGLPVSSGRGSCFATLRFAAPTAAKLPSIDIIGLEDHVAFSLETPRPEQNGQELRPLRLFRVRRTGEAEQFYRLTGDLAVTNAFSWPSVEVTPSANPYFEQATLPGDDKAVRISHRAIIGFHGDAIEYSSGDAHLVRAIVRHSFERGQAILPVQAYQLIRFMPTADFRRRLEMLAPPAQTKPDELRKLETGFLPIVGPEGQPLTVYQAAPHFLHLAATGPAGISGPLAAGLLKTMTEETRFLAIDLSAHLLLDHQGVDAKSVILGSHPTIAFRVPDDVDLPWATSDAVLQMLASKVDTNTPVIQPASDGLAARMLPPLARAKAVLPAARRGETSQSDERSNAASRLAKDTQERDHRPVFQAVVLSQQDDFWRPAWHLPGAATAMHLSTLLDLGANAVKPVAVGFRPFGGIAADDLFPGESAGTVLQSATTIDPAHYEHAMQRFQARLVRDLIDGPAIVSPQGRPTAPVTVLFRIVARSRDGDSQRVVAQQQEMVAREDLQKALDNIVAWGQASLERLAPWASVAMASATVMDVDGAASAAAILKSSRPRSGNAIVLQSPARDDRPAQRQRQQVVRHSAGNARTAAGYAPVAAEPRLLTSEPAWTYGEDDVDYRLTAHGVAMAWSLPAGGAAELGACMPSEVSEYWITDRYRPAFRPSDPDGKEITSALPRPFGAQMPASRMPASHATPRLRNRLKDDKDATRQFFAPALVTVSRISSRPGAFAVTRTGLVSAADGSMDWLAALESSETPLAMRQPRPPVLARNDRTRASSHEPGPFVLSKNPSVIVHGPRVAAMGASALPSGLDRQPRSLFATGLLLDEPHAGITSDWDGIVRMKVTGVFGDHPDNAWTVRSAAIVIGKDRYRWIPEVIKRKDDQGKEIEEAVTVTVGGLDTTVKLISFRGSPGGAGSEQSALQALRVMPPATAAVLEITLDHARAGGNLLRQIRFDLLAAGQGMSVPGVETPLFFRFDDPEYNDQLNGLAKVSRENSPTIPLEDFVFAADMADIRRDQRLELALALRPASASTILKTGFGIGANDGYLSYQTRLLELTLSRRRVGYNTPQRLGVGDGGIEGASPDQSGAIRLVHGGEAPPGSTTFHAMKLDCALLYDASNPSDMPALAPDDQLELAIMCQGSKLPLVVLRFDVVVRPDMPSNQSAFGVLMLKPAIRAVSVHLFSAGPDATVLELVDPLDLVEGVVRRRAIFQWRSFQPSSELRDGQGKTAPVRFALQKTNGVGGTWLPAAFSDGWLAVLD
jgi:hypothetical protein